MRLQGAENADRSAADEEDITHTYTAGRYILYSFRGV
jgi:hypothetical protein